MEINELTKVKAELACTRLANEGKEMSGHCENCGCRKVSGYCTNCQEEAYIAFEQAPEMQFSEEFMQKAWRQESEREATNE